MPIRPSDADADAIQARQVVEAEVVNTAGEASVGALNTPEQGGEHCIQQSDVQGLGEVHLQLAPGHVFQDRAGIRIGQQVIVEEDEPGAALKQAVQVADAPHTPFLAGHDAERAAVGAAAGEETDGRVAQLRVEVEVGGKVFDLRRQA